MIFMPTLTSENNRVILTRLVDFEPDNVVFEDVLTVLSMLSDISLITPDVIEENKLADGEILIYDLNGLSTKHLTKLGFSAMRCFFRYMMEAHPMRVRQIHLINCSSLLDKIVMLIRPFIGSNAMKVMHFHAPDSTTLYDFLPREILPVEIGGTDETLESVKQYWIKRTENYRYVTYWYHFLSDKLFIDVPMCFLNRRDFKSSLFTVKNFLNTSRDYLVDNSNWTVTDEVNSIDPENDDDPLAYMGFC